MEYIQLLKELHETEPQPNPNYWKIVSQHPTIILYQLVIKEKKQVAGELGMSPSKFSAILPLLKALARQESDNGITNARK